MNPVSDNKLQDNKSALLKPFPRKAYDIKAYSKANIDLKLLVETLKIKYDKIAPSIDGFFKALPHIDGVKGIALVGTSVYYPWHAKSFSDIDLMIFDDRGNVRKFFLAYSRMYPEFGRAVNILPFSLDVFVSSRTPEDIYTKHQPLSSALYILKSSNGVIERIEQLRSTLTEKEQKMLLVLTALHQVRSYLVKKVSEGAHMPYSPLFMHADPLSGYVSMIGGVILALKSSKNLVEPALAHAYSKRPFTPDFQRTFANYLHKVVERSDYWLDSKLLDMFEPFVEVG